MDNNSKSGNRLSSIMVIILSFLIITILNVFSYRMNFDNGIFLSGAWSLFNGFEIYNDFFSFTSPGTYYLISWTWKTLFVSYWLAWALGVILLVISALMIFKIAERLSYRGAILAVFIFSLLTINFPIINAHIFCLPFLLFSTYLFLVAREKESSRLLVLSGLMAGLTTIFLQTIGLAFIGAVLLFVFIHEDKQQIIKQGLMFLIATILPIIIMFFKWSPIFLFKQLILFPLQNYSETLDISYWLWLFFAISLLILLVLFKVRKLLSREVKFLFILQALLLLTALTFPDPFHIISLSAGFFILTTFLLIGLFENKNRQHNKFFWLTLIFLGIFFSYLLAYFLYNLASFSFSLKSIKLFINPPIFSLINDNCQSDYIYAGPFIPNIYFENRKILVGPSHWLLTNHHSSEMFKAAYEDLQDKQPDCAVINYSTVAKFNYNKNNPVDEYLMENYEPKIYANKIIIFKKITP